MPSIDGIISGLNTTEVIEGLLAFQRQPIRRLEERIAANTEKKAALTTLAAKLLALQGRARSLSTSRTFSPLSVSSSDESVLSARAGEGLSPGTYRFNVEQLAQSEQYVSGGYANATTAVGAGTLSVESGDGFVDRETDLDLLNGGQGVRLGRIRITGSSGVTTTVDLSRVVTIDDVIDEINASGIGVSARVAGAADSDAGRSLVLEDSTGGAGNIIVTEVDGGSTALDLGIRGTGTGATLQGSEVLSLGSAFQLGQLNDGLGVRARVGSDLSIQTRDGSSYTVDLGSATTLAEVFSAINSQTESKVTVTAQGGRLVATDSSGGAGTFSIANAAAAANAGTDLGLIGSTSASDTITGDLILSDFNSVLLGSLNGGSGVTAGSVTITARDGDDVTIDLSAARTLSEVVDLINSGASGIGVSASVSSNGLGLELRDASGGVGDLVVAAGDTADDLGLTGSVSSDVLTGDDLNIRYLNENTRLETLNGGRGVFAGRIRVTASDGGSFEVNLESVETLGDAILNINNAAGNDGSVVASFNSRGDGILLTSTAGTASLRVNEVGGGTTARDLNLLGVAPDATPTVIDGSFQFDVAIDSDDTLEDVARKVNDLGRGFRATVVNDGSSINPTRLQISGTATGAGNRVLLNPTGGTSLAFGRTARARDAVVFYGSTEDGSQPIVVRSNTNRFENVVGGLNLTARNTSSREVVVTAVEDTEEIKEKIQSFVEEYNSLVETIREQTRFDAELDVRGVLFGDSITRTIERALSNSVTRRIAELPSGKNAASNIGIRFEANGTLSFDESQFDSLLAEDPTAVESIFTRHRSLEPTTLLEDFGNGDGVDTSGGDQLEITLRDGSSFTVNLQGDRTVDDVLRSIARDSRSDPDDAGTARVQAEIATGGRSIVLTDLTSGGTSFRVAASNNSSAFAQLGLNTSVDAPGGATITGSEIDLTRDGGVALRLLEAIEGLLDTDDGSVTLRSDFYTDQIEQINERIEQKRSILEIREATLKRQFSQLEVVLAENQNTLLRLNAALGSLSGLSF